MSSDDNFKIRRELNPRQEKFCEEYARTGNARQSAIASGCSPVSASGYANRLLRQDHVRFRLEELRADARRASVLSGVDFQLVLQAAATIDTGVFFEKHDPCPKCGRGDYTAVPIPELPEEVRRAIQAFKITRRGGDKDGKRELILTYEYTLIPKASALELLGKTHGAFIDKKVNETSTRFQLIVERLRSSQGRAVRAPKHHALPPAESEITVQAVEAD